jgi:hypothetical protein
MLINQCAYGLARAGRGREAPVPFRVPLAIARIHNDERTNNGPSRGNAGRGKKRVAPIASSLSLSVSWLIISVSGAVRIQQSNPVADRRDKVRDD